MPRGPTITSPRSCLPGLQVRLSVEATSRPPSEVQVFLHHQKLLMGGTVVPKALLLAMAIQSVYILNARATGVTDSTAHLRGLQESCSIRLHVYVAPTQGSYVAGTMSYVFFTDQGASPLYEGAHRVWRAGETYSREFYLTSCSPMYALQATFSGQATAVTLSRVWVEEESGNFEPGSGYSSIRGEQYTVGSGYTDIPLEEMFNR